MIGTIAIVLVCWCVAGLILDLIPIVPTWVVLIGMLPILLVAAAYCWVCERLDCRY